MTGCFLGSGNAICVERVGIRLLSQLSSATRSEVAWKFPAAGDRSVCSGPLRSLTTRATPYRQWRGPKFCPRPNAN